MNSPTPQADASPATPIDDDAPVGASKLGLALFALYTLLYLGFVLINAFRADAMETVVLAGLNLAIVYGFGLILAAILMAFIYGFSLRTRSDAGGHVSGDAGGDVATSTRDGGEA